MKNEKEKIQELAQAVVLAKGKEISAFNWSGDGKASRNARLRWSCYLTAWRIMTGRRDEPSEQEAGITPRMYLSRGRDIYSVEYYMKKQ